jgi:hypothetical protein
MNSISELMGKDPLSLTRDDLNQIVEYYRANRLQFIQGDKRAARPAKTKVALPKLELKDLDI